MSETGRIAVFKGNEEPFDLREYPVPDPGPNEILLKVTSANVCGSDLHMWKGETDLRKLNVMWDVAFGHELTGRVAKLGKHVGRDALGNGLKEGDQVTFRYFIPCGECRPCSNTLDNACLRALTSVLRPVDVAPHFVAGFADYYMAQSVQHIIKLPKGLPGEIAAGANCALSQVLYGLHKVNLTMGETVVVQGLGGLGLYATAVAKEMGAKTIIAIDAIPARLELAQAFGATHLIDIREIDDPRKRTGKVRGWTDDWGADVVVEVVGIPDVIPEGIRMLARGGRYLVMGSINPKRTYKADPSLLIGGNISMHGVSLYPTWALDKSIDFLSRTHESIPYDRMGKAYKLEDITQAFEDANAFGKEGTEVVRAQIVMADS